MIKIGLTGGIGSGKSTVAKIFASLGVPVYDADKATKELMVSNAVIRQKITEAFGNEAYSNGVLNRPYIATIVFNNSEKLELLNAITHPITIADANEWFSKQTGAYAIKEAALIFESHSNKYLDKIIGVYAPDELRIERTMQRDGTSKEKVLERINKQMPQDEKMKYCDYVIDNGGLQPLLPQVFKLHQLFNGA